MSKMIDDFESRFDKYRKLRASENSTKGAFPEPDQEKILLEIKKKNGAETLKPIQHKRKIIEYLFFAPYKRNDNFENILSRWISISATEIKAVMNAFMDGYEIAYNMERDIGEGLRIPHVLCTLQRKTGVANSVLFCPNTTIASS